MRAADVTKRLLDARAGGNGALTKKRPRLTKTPADGAGNGVFGDGDVVMRGGGEWEPLPEDALPDGLRELVQHGGKALGVDPALIALPGLAVLATCIGTTRALLLRRSWFVYAILWVATVVRSGGRKSPAQALVVDPLHKLQLERMREYEVALERYEAASLQYKTALGDWQKGKPGVRGEPPTKPVEPAPVRYLTSDTTIEALAWLLMTNRRGVGVFNDELAGHLRSFDAYKGKTSGDAARWLELYRAGTLVADRRTGNPRTICVPRAAVSVAGTVQPSTLQRLLTPEYYEMGLAARFIFAEPPDLPRRHIEADVPLHVMLRYEETLTRLLALDHADDEYNPVIVRLSNESKGLWVAWCNEIGESIDSAFDDDARAALAKHEELPARFGLIDHCVQSATNPDYPADVLQSESMRRGISLTRWASRATNRVLERLKAPEGSREADKIITWIAGRGGSCTVRDITHNVWRFREDTDGATAVLKRLVSAGLGSWTYTTGSGRPSAVFRLTPKHHHTETLTDVPETEGIGDEQGGNGAASPIGESDGVPARGTPAAAPPGVLEADCRGDDPPADFCYGT